MHIEKTAIPLLKRVAVFLCIFVGLSGGIGPTIIANNLLHKYGFFIYGTMGKTLIFGAIAFGLLAYHRKRFPSLNRFNQKSAIAFGSICTVAYVIAWICVKHLITTNTPSLLTIASAHIFLLFSVVMVLYAVFGARNIVKLLRFYQKEFIISVLTAVGFAIFLELVYGLWRSLAFIVMHSVQWLLSLHNVHAEIFPPLTLVFDKFGVTIEKTCSGIESIALFSGLYALIGLIDKQKINFKKFFIALPIGLVGLFVFNIIRVYGLIAAGYYINPEIAFSLFHTYAGMVFFILYSGIFWGFAYKRIIKTP